MRVLAAAHSYQHLVVSAFLILAVSMDVHGYVFRERFICLKELAYVIVGTLI